MSELSADERQTLLDIARRSIEHGLRHEHCALSMDIDYSPALTAPRASFVTLKIGNELRGCIGSLEPLRPLAQDVHENAYSAAFRDPRFQPLTMLEWPGLRLSLSILSVPEPLAANSEAELLLALRPGVDGVILEYGQQRGTFLPAVWASLNEPREFVRQLKLKTGLPADFWSDALRVYRYTATHIEED